MATKKTTGKVLAGAAALKATNPVAAAPKVLPKPPLKKGKLTKLIAEVYGDVMIDLETLDTKVTAAILAIGAVRFNKTTLQDDGFYRVITIQSNIDEGRTISGSTLKWWMDQTERARSMLNDPSAIPLGQALDELREWIGKDSETICPWGNSARFDLGILDHAYGQQGTPWKFYNERCFRTTKETPAAKLVPKPENAGAHNALFDAVAQAQHLQAIWEAA